jgi:type IX secretion system PorP/SprF family membrane protein
LQQKATTPLTRFLVVLLLFSANCALAQLPIYTLYYTNPLPINPAFTGSAHKLRAGVGFRTQWTNYVSPVNAYSFYADNFFAKINSGIGVSVYTDATGNTNFRTTQVALSYSYTAKLQDNIYLKAGTQASLTQTGFSGGSLTFNDQVTSTGYTNSGTAETLPLGSKKLYPNVSAGLLLTANSFWVGASGYNLLMPRAGYTDQSKLPIGFGLQVGTKIQFDGNTVARRIEKKERFIMPNAMLTVIGTSKLLYLGTEVVYDPFCFGAMLRGNFFSKADGISNIASLAITFGIRTGGYLQSNYVYEIPLSSKASLLGPTHEISIRTTLKMWQRPSRRPVKRLDLF